MRTSATRDATDHDDPTVQCTTRDEMSAQLQHSPRQLLQRNLMDATFGDTVQRVDADDDEPLQGKFADSAASVPRATDTDGARGENRTGMSDQLKSNMEAMSGFDLSDVRVHRNSEKPAQLNALAYAQGDEIHLGPGQDQHLPHEAWHVIQQRQGRVRASMQMAGDVPINTEPSLEQEADLMGVRAMQPLHVAALSVSPSRSSAQLPIQRKLKVNGETWDTQDAEFVEDATSLAWSELQEKINEAIALAPVGSEIAVESQQLLATLNGPGKASYKAQLCKWVDDRPQRDKVGKHEIFGRKQQNREYANWIEVAHALTGWVHAKYLRNQEKRFARDVYSNPEADAVLTGLVHKVRLRIEAYKTTKPLLYLEVMKELSQPVTLTRGVMLEGNLVKQNPTRYGHYEKEMEKAATEFSAPRLQMTYRTKLEILDQPDRFTLREKIVLLHDITEYFGKRQPWNPLTAGQNQILVDNEDDARVTTQVDAEGERSDSVSALKGNAQERKFARGMGLTTASRAENAPSTRFARERNIPVWAGQSMTTVRMLNMAQWAGAKVYEMNALAQGLIAFWRLDYNHTSDFAYHTLHEVMDMAKNFGVQYKIPPVGMRFDFINAEYLRPCVQAIVDDLEQCYALLMKQYHENTWLNADLKRTATVNLEALRNRLAALQSWWAGFDFRAADVDQRKAALTRILVAANILQKDAADLDAFTKLRSSSVGANFSWSAS